MCVCVCVTFICLNICSYVNVYIVTFVLFNALSCRTSVSNVSIIIKTCVHACITSVGEYEVRARR